MAISCDKELAGPRVGNFTETQATTYFQSQPHMPHEFTFVVCGKPYTMESWSKYLNI